MKLKAAFLLILFFTAFAPSGKSQPFGKEPQSKVLVELFTAEGCPTCPPAGKALTALQREQPNPNAEIVTLAFHVDYWNQRGWKDPFSSPLFSQRQQFYTNKFKISGSYTPQMVVDGSYEFVGSNSDKAKQFISEAAKTAKAKIELQRVEENLRVKISELPKHGNSTVYLAIAEDNLSSNVKKGENSSVKLEHISVVRELKLLGSLPGASETFAVESPLQFQPNWKKENLKLVVFIQEIQSRRVIGVNYLKN